MLVRSREANHVDSREKIRELVRAEHTFGADWIKTMNTGGYMSFGDDPAKVTWFEDEMQCLAKTARQMQRDDIGVLAPGEQADIVAMPGDPVADIAATEKVDFVMRAGRICRHGALDVFHS